MTIDLKFLGAARTVTGSCYLVDHPNGRFLVDCGMFQGTKTLRELNYGPFPFDPKTIDFVLLTHAHIDHSGLVPKLCTHGFRGPVHATAGTRDLLTYMLPDSGYIQETEVEHLNRRNAARGRPQVTPIYTKADAEAALSRLSPVEPDAWIEPGPGVRARFWNAGHILGAASIEIEVSEADPDQAPARFLFSGDVGPRNKAFHDDPQGPRDLDYLIVETTYGGRDRPEMSEDQRREALRKVVAGALAAGGNLLIPAFAIERTQELLHDLDLLLESGALPKAPVFLDSPLAIRATEVFTAHADALEGVDGPDAFRNPNFRFVAEAAESRSLARISGGAIIIAASGMCDAGRIRHHLADNLWRPEATVLLVGYQAPGTLGSLLQNGARSVRIHGREVAVRANVERLDVYSAHADRAELRDWVKARLPVHRAVFLAHGEEEGQSIFRQTLARAGLREDRIHAPRLDEVWHLSPRGRLRHALDRPRLKPDEVATFDWHNEYAAFVLELSEAVRALPDDAARHRKLAELKRVLEAH